MLNKIARISFYLFIFLLPWQTRYFFYRGQAGGWEFEAVSLTIYVTEFLLWLAIILVLPGLIKLAIKLYRQAPGRKKINWTLVGIILFIAWSGLSIFWSGNRQVAYWHWFKLLEVAAAGSLLIILKINFKKVAACLAAAGTWQGWLAIRQFSDQTIVANKWLGMASQNPADLGVSVVENGGRWLRAYGAWPHPNMLGGFLAVTLLLTSYLFLKVKKPYQRWVCLLALVIQVFGLWLTFSRAAVAVAGLFLALYGLFEIIKRKNSEAKFLLGLVVVLFLIGGSLFSARLVNPGRLETKSNNERQTQYRQAWQLITQRPLIGWGIGNYQIINRQQLPGQPAYDYQPPHNLFLLIWSELGLVGLMSFLFFLFSIFFQSMKNKLLSDNMPSCLLVGLLFVLALFDHYFWTNWAMLVIFWIILYLAVKQKLAY